MDLFKLIDVAYWEYVFNEFVTDIRFAWRFRRKTFFLMGQPCSALERRAFNRIWGSPYARTNNKWMR